LVHLDLPSDSKRENLDELRELARSAGAEVVGTVTGTRRAPDSRYFVGSGKADEIADALRLFDAELVLFNHALAATQERNLETKLNCRVLDRTGLILDIFAQRAHSHEGKLQVELAQLRHLSTRLVRGWTHLERQKGGIGLRGPGETQLETDRRLIGQRIRQLRSRLDKVEKQRAQGRRARHKTALPTVALVGYTNAGKSTVFNHLTNAGVYQADQLFATLDPTLRRIELPGGSAVILADTVGFIRHLPHELVAAFRSTLDETRDADLLLHVVDAHDPERQDHTQQVHLVLEELDAADIPIIEVYNKIDLLEDTTATLDRAPDGKPKRVWMSAATNSGMGLLQEAIGEHFDDSMVLHRLRLPATAGRLRAELFDIGAVNAEHYNDQGELLLDVELRQRALEDLLRRAGLDSKVIEASTH
jgi:GTP-binding protein HflX